MPEGDNVHRHARDVGARLVGRKVTALYARGVSYGGLIGETVTSVQAHGKHLLIDVGTRARLHVHLGMNGRVRIAAANEFTVPRAARASLAVATDEAVVFWTAARTVEVLRAAFAHAHPVLRALGPDLLSDDFNISDVVTRARERAAQKAVGELLLDQRIASGIGNVYKSEVLFLERLNPWTRVSQLEAGQLEALYTRARLLMKSNLGPWPRTTTADLTRGGRRPRLSGGPAGAAAHAAAGVATTASGANTATIANTGRLHVYGRQRRPCPVCGEPIALRAQGSPARSTYYCPHCQPASEVTRDEDRNAPNRR